MHMVVSGLLDDMDAFLAENSHDLRGRPVFVNDHLLNAPPQSFWFAMVPYESVLARIRFYLSIAPHIFTIW